MTVAPETFPRCNLDEELMAEVVERRVRGESWAEAAQAIEWGVADLKRACRSDPGYNAAYEYAQRELDREDEARVRRKLREGLENPERDKAQKAAELLAKHLAAKRRDETRLEVERLRAAARQASAQAHARNADSEPELTPEEEKQVNEAWDRHQVQHGDKISREKHPVFLWSGCHKIGNTPPDNTDIPLLLFADMTVSGRTIYWAVTTTPPTHVKNGPFLPPPGRPL